MRAVGTTDPRPTGRSVERNELCGGLDLPAPHRRLRDALDGSRGDDRSRPEWMLRAGVGRSGIFRDSRLHQRSFFVPDPQESSWLPCVARPDPKRQGRPIRCGSRLRRRTLSRGEPSIAPRYGYRQLPADLSGQIQSLRIDCSSRVAQSVAHGRTHEREDAVAPNGAFRR